MEKLAGGDDRLAVCGPAVEELVNRDEHVRALPFIERRRDAKDPNSRVGWQLRNVDMWHSIYTPRVSFAKLMQRFKGGVQQAEPQQDPRRVATAAVLLEIAHADGQFSPAEDGDVVGYLKNAFQLNDEAAQELLAEAEQLRNRTIDHFALTNFIRKNSPLAERIEIVKTMWRIVYSDRKLTEYENYLVRKLADLLGLEHHVMIDAKLSVLRELGFPSS